MSAALRVEQGIRRISRALAWLAGGIVVVCSLLVVLDIVTRALFGRVVFESFEFSCYGFAAAFGLGLAHTAIERANVRVDIVNMLLGARLRLVLDVLAAIALALTAVVFAWHASGTVMTSFGMGARSNSSLSVPLVYPQSIWAFGIVWFAFVAILLALRSLLALLAGDRATVQRLAGLRATSSADAERESI
jgi:TRAP-type mannitol/chloroaromatic compound transport system permease small subunit